MSRQVVKVCAICGKEFETTRKEKIYCSRSCAIKAKAEKDKLWREANAGKC
jgi:DNA-directed RNA polymerase subunit RPC12/RpoP